MAINGKPHRFILCNDGGTLVGTTLDAPMGDEGLVDLTIGPLLGTQINTLYWQLGTDPAKGTPTEPVSIVSFEESNRRWRYDLRHHPCHQHVIRRQIPSFP